LQPERLCVFGLSEARDASAAAVVLTTAADFHHVRLVSFLAVFAAVLAVLFGRTIARPVLAFVGDFVSHDRLLLIVDSIFRGIGYDYARRVQLDGQDADLFNKRDNQ
jgi:hypothetical protein